MLDGTEVVNFLGTLEINHEVTIMLMTHSSPPVSANNSTAAGGHAVNQNNVRIVCTVGPTSLNRRVLRCLEARNVALVRLNMSHIDIDKLQLYLEMLKQFSIPIAIDTEGSQIRTGLVALPGVEQITTVRRNRHHGAVEQLRGPRAAVGRHAIDRGFRRARHAFLVA